MFSFGEISALCCAFVWAGSNLILQTQSQKLPLLLMNVARCAAGTLLFWAMLPFEDPLTAYQQVPAREWAAVFGSMVVGVCIGDTIFLLAIREIGASHASAVGSIQPVNNTVFRMDVAQVTAQLELVCWKLLRCPRGDLFVARGLGKPRMLPTCPKPRGSQSEYRLPC